MLIEFSIENFRSIKEEVTFSLLASPDKSLEKNTFESEALNKGDRLLRTAAIYGANASGKSNMVMAFGTLREMVLNSMLNRPGDLLVHTPFKLDEGCLEKPTRFKVVFIHNNVQYVYGVAFTGERIVEEFLHYYPRGRKSLIFERKVGNGEQEAKFTKDRRVQKGILDRTLDNVLYLSSSAQQKYEKTMEVFRWFREELTVIQKADHPGLMDYTVELLGRSEEYKKLILKTLVAADLGIEDILVEYRELPFESFSSKLSGEQGWLSVRESRNKSELVDIKTVHRAGIGNVTGIENGNVNRIGSENENGNETVNEEWQEKGTEKVSSTVQFDFYEDESEGTKRIFYLIGPFIDALVNGKTLVLDELDLRMHPVLCEYLVKLFQDPSRNKKNAQLVFATHDVNLLDLNLFRRDQVWFTEKDPGTGSTELFSLTEFSPRRDKNIRKGYLAGRYGALPFIGAAEGLN
ncbi:AAA family ATPase [Methanosarcina sp. Mfa9]|uniref:AAA family ATPase n=1 Tax=Methanosarcina sp. Mfa9 TaxID=3439063 RepID=UPI003F83C2F6